MESVREEALDMTCLTRRGNGKGQRLGLSQKAGVLGGFPYFGLAKVLDFCWEVVRDEAWLLTSSMSPFVK